MPLKIDLPSLTEKRLEINRAFLAPEKETVTRLLEEATFDEGQNRRIKERAMGLVGHVREARLNSGGIDAFMHQYSLSSEEGIALMCLAEALLRVPDKATVDELIKDKVSGVDWGSHIGQSKSFFVNATTWALMLTGKVLEPQKDKERTWTGALKGFVGRSSEGVIRKAVAKAMQIMSKQFVMGRNIQEAIKRAKKLEAMGYCYSYDMLGEAALTEADAKTYFEAYHQAILSIGQSAKGVDIFKSPGISVKLSALYPRYEVAKHSHCVDALSSRLLTLCQKAKEFDIALTVDAEEAIRLDLSLDVFERVFKDPSLDGWQGLGLALQSYQKRAFYVLDYLAELAKSQGRRIMVRLIKGAYWDSEIKHAQMEGLNDYPVFTYKSFTDVSFQACAKKLFSLKEFLFPKIATHNAYSVAMILELAGEERDFEFQCLHGMGQELYDEITGQDKLNIPCRIYAPVGSHEDLLPYLVRRLLENGANSSFVNRIVDDKAPIESLVESPVETASALLDKINAQIPLPQNIFRGRLNSSGINVADYQGLHTLVERLSTYQDSQWQAHSLVKGLSQHHYHEVVSPNDHSRILGEVAFASDDVVELALSQGGLASRQWQAVSVEQRAQCLEKAAELLDQNQDEWIALLMLEAGKTLNDAIAEIREAVDFCRYYAIEAKEKLASGIDFHGYTGESNHLSYEGRGLVLCISPWNFPLAIFMGQVVASLVAGNAVIAKPAEQTSLIAFKAVKLLHQANVPEDVLQLVLGEGETVASPMVNDSRIKAVVFTGSTETAKIINRQLAQREGEIIPLIAETGGQNVMLIDSSALLEQVINDVVVSAFGSAGQRCSALRVAYVQEDIYDAFIKMLEGAMAELNVQVSYDLSADVGPVIDQTQFLSLKKHIDEMTQKDALIYQCRLNEGASQGHFIAPVAFKINSINELSHENFGPILHVVSYRKRELDKVINDINQAGFGLTLGVHSRIDEVAHDIARKVHVGNVYVNRNMIGAVVGLQPFGGQGLSGTGPKAGGPNYLLRLCHEKTVTTDTTAAGGNASLMSEV